MCAQAPRPRTGRKTVPNAGFQAASPPTSRDEDPTCHRARSVEGLPSDNGRTLRRPRVALDLIGRTRTAREPAFAGPRSEGLPLNLSRHDVSGLETIELHDAIGEVKVQNKFNL